MSDQPSNQTDAEVQRLQNLLIIERGEHFRLLSRQNRLKAKIAMLEGTIAFRFHNFSLSLSRALPFAKPKEKKLVPSHSKRPSGVCDKIR